MAKAKQFDPLERKRLRRELTIIYRKQANHIRLYKKLSNKIAADIQALRTRLAVVDKKSIGKEYEDKPAIPSRPRNPRRLKNAWYCSRPECGNIIPDGQEKIMFKKRHYCSLTCALSDGGQPFREIPGKDKNITESKGSVEDG